MSQSHLQFITKALRSGFTESQIAANLCITQSAVHQYIESHNLAAEVAQNEQLQEIDNNLNDIELVLTRKLKHAVQYAPLDPMQLGALLKVVNSTRRRTVEPTHAAEGTLVYLPAHTVTPLVGVKNARNELVELNGRSFTTMPSGQLYEHADKELLHGV